jgi:motility quorum-sensing regulator/GCU-specific mRNA interferase toxin
LGDRSAQYGLSSANYLRKAPLRFIYLKLRPTRDLEAFKRVFARERTVTYTASRSALASGYRGDDVAALLSGLTRLNFVKSVTSHTNHKQWQDVYYIDDSIRTIYVKFTDQVLTEFILLSFKRK